MIVILLGDSKKCNKIFMVQSAFKLQRSCVLKRHSNLLHLRSLSSESEINYCANPQLAITIKAKKNTLKIHTFWP